MCYCDMIIYVHEVSMYMYCNYMMYDIKVAMMINAYAYV